ncbi:pilus assembly protein PilX [Ferrimonas pelagia]|uniref:Pilus assembly PilX N-terminal domain-containing protein n=1 Tax=Ferrimonas pelagia TaxID=1177826 RepID=A0ABP9EBA0_9GAMM
MRAQTSGQQHGMVLIVTTLLLLILTLVALGLATRTRQAMQISAAGIAREGALQQANGGQEGFVEAQRLMRGDSIFVTAQGEPGEVLGVENEVTFLVETVCRRSRNATASGVLSCRQNQLESVIRFGKNQRGRFSVVAGVEQPVLISSGGGL